MTKQEIIMRIAHRANTTDELHRFTDLLRDMFENGCLEAEVWTDVIPKLAELAGELARVEAGKEYDEGRAIK